MAAPSTPATLMLLPDLPVAEDWVRAAQRHQLAVPVRVKPGPITPRLPDWEGRPLTLTRPRLRARRFRGVAAERLDVAQLTRLVDHLGGQGLNITLAHGHFASASGGLPGLLARRDIPYVVSEHSSALTFDNPHKHVSASGLRRARAVYEAAERVLPVSAALGRALVARGLVASDGVVATPNPVDVDRFTPPARPPTTPTIVTVARLVGVKRLEVLIDAFAEIHRARPEVRLDIVGEGPEQAALEGRARSLGVAHHICFHGRLDRSQVAQVLRTARVFALSSFTENLPVAALEAMASGLPVVAPAVGGLPELLADAPGEVVTPGSVPALAKALIRWLDADGDSGVAARRLATSRYSVTAVGDQLTTIYSDAVSRRSSATLTRSSKG